MAAAYFHLLKGPRSLLITILRPSLSKHRFQTPFKYIATMVNVEETRRNYNELQDHLKELARLRGAQAVLVWDQNVGMPSGSGEARGNQLATLAAITLEKETSPALGALITNLNDTSMDGLNEYERANVRDAKRNYERSTKTNKDLEMRIARLQTKGYMTWDEAKKKNDFALFKPILEEWVDIWEEKAALLDPTKSVYDVALDTYERGLTSERVDALFKVLKEEIPPLIRQVKESSVQPEMSFVKQSYEVEEQVKFNHRLAKELGFDTDIGRLDVSPHPFTINLHPTDVRITTKYTEDDLFNGLFGTIHECGHAFYEQGRNKEYADMPVSEPVSLGIHESQSLFWERLVGLNPKFWEHYLPILRTQFPAQLPETVTPAAFHRAANAVRPGLIRIAADELTYPMHIILRYELERALLERRIKVEDLPHLWNEKMREYLGVEVPNDSQGVLQDMHWSDGSFGYFPTYTLGACYSVMWWKRIKQDIPDIEDKFLEGDFTSLRRWLNENIHVKGSLYPSGDELVEKVTGESLDTHVYVNYLKEKFGGLYQLNL